MDYLLDILSEKNLTAEEIEMIRNSFLLLIMTPLVTTIAGIARYIIGLKNLRIHAPIILTFAFYELGYIQADQESDVLRGLQFGLVLFLIVFFVSALIYTLLRKLRMHYIPKTTIVLTGVSVSVILAIFFGTLLFERKGLVYLDIFSVIMIVTLSESFVSLLARKSFGHTTRVAIQTLITSILAYVLISLPQTSDIAINYSILLIILLVVINLFIGRFIGLRLTEYWRFRDLIFNYSDNETNGSHNKSTKKQKKDSRAE